MHKKNIKNSFVTIILLLLLLIFLAFYLHLVNGMFDISVSKVFQTLFNLNDNEKFRLVVFEFRLPRIIIAILIGIGLSRNIRNKFWGRGSSNYIYVFY